MKGQPPVPAAGDDRLHHEDLATGKAYVFGSRTVMRDEIFAFSSAYDPEPPHIDEGPTAVDGLCASPLHVCALMMRMLCDGLLNRVASLGSPGVDEVRWMVPVRPGDVLRTRYTVCEKRNLASRPDVGISKVLVELLNGRDEVVSSWITNQLTRRRHPGQPQQQPAKTKGQRQALSSLWDDPAPAARPACDAYFEDRLIGETTAYGRHAFLEEEIIAFARRYDPQPFHIDAASAKVSLFGGLCASGWHTAAIFMRNLVSARMLNNAAARSQGISLPAVEPSPAWRDLRWPKPVYVGDLIAFRARVSEKVASATPPDRGLIASEVQGRNQRGEIVLQFTFSNLVERRQPHRP